MKKVKPIEISQYQFITLIFGSQVGIGVLSLPSDLAKISGTDSWIAILAGWILAVIASVMIIQVMKKHPEETLYDLIPRYFGKVMGKAINICIAFYFYFAFFTSFFASVSIMQLELLPKTPDYALVILFAVPVYLILRHHAGVLARYSQATFGMFLWLLALYVIPLKDAVWLHLLPVIKEGWMPVLNSMKTTTLSYLGFETAFIFYPFLKNKSAAVKGVIIGNTLTMLLYLIVTIVCIVSFSPKGILTIGLPTLKIVKVVEFRFLERFEIIFLVMYLFLLSKVWMFNLYCGLVGSSHVLGKADHRPHLVVCLVCLIALSLFYSPEFDEIDRFKSIWSHMGTYFAFALPLFLLVFTRSMDRLRKES
ncbi:GerAB/ArcD/ProY family transporter [Paenibacillus cremeus]|uniref:GerAB/ArcD/ProY family transporter n=1 Tax=Paenibacillus cremeus TaxID=2163881 RepID=A0A559JSQ6_9BACL|nr:endospore germination permease [Paenibacillus cremeus]TVY02909.1 GerAB/ArcD/ProY family transporter [Paenibacillus cremeus]